MALKRSQADGSPPKPAIPESWQSKALQRSSSSNSVGDSLNRSRQKRSFGGETEAQRIANALTAYLALVPDEHAFDFADYNELERGQGVHAGVLATHLKTFVDLMLTATHGRIHCKQSLEAAIREVMRTHKHRSFFKELSSKTMTWLKTQIYCILDHVRKLRNLSQFLIDGLSDYELEVCNGWVEQLRTVQNTPPSSRDVSRQSSVDKTVATTTVATTLIPVPKPTTVFFV